MTDTEGKMYYIAKHYNWLNDKGNVKAIKGNEKGYAKIKDIVRGCSLCVHHLNNGQLIINLLISFTAKSRYEVACSKAVDVFKNHFQSEVKNSTWESSMGDGRVYDRYFVDVTNSDLPEIVKMIEEVRNKLSDGKV